MIHVIPIIRILTYNSERAIFCTTLPVSYPVVINAQHMVASSLGAKHSLDEVQHITHTAACMRLGVCVRVCMH
jgi:hypothetical protein